jgi:hypothetical protein
VESEAAPFSSNSPVPLLISTPRAPSTKEAVHSASQIVLVGEEFIAFECVNDVQDYPLS